MRREEIDQLINELEKCREKLSAYEPSSTKTHKERDAVPRKRRWQCQVKHRSSCGQVLEILKELRDVDKKHFHKPKIPSNVKLSCLCDTLPTKDTITPQILHLLRRYFEDKDPDNGFESEVFAYLGNLDSQILETLRFGLKVYDEIPTSKKQCLFREEFLNWPLEKPVDAETLAKTWVDEATILGRDFLYDQVTCQVGKVRPWERELPSDPDNPQTNKVFAPWPWINSVNDLRTPKHRQLLDYYLPQEYLKECTFTLDQDSQEMKAQCWDATWPNCESPGQQHKGKCLRIPEARAGQVANLIGFNFFSENCMIKLMHTEKPYEYFLEATICGDAKTPIKQPDGTVIADHRVTDHLSFQIPDKTPDGLYEFVPGIYQLRVIVPNDINYTLADGSKLKEFASNDTFLRILPSQKLKYRIWVDKGHCYNETDGEWASDEIYLKAIPVVTTAVGDTPSWLDLPATETWTWSDVDEGDTLYGWDWRIVGEPGNPLNFEGILAIGLIGYEVDSEDALKEQVKTFGDAYLQYLKNIWGILAATGAIGGAIGALKLIALTWAILIAGCVIAAILIVGLIWAAWAPADRILFDVIILTEEDLFFLTNPKTPLPAESEQKLGFDHDINRCIIPESKLDYLYVEERRYRSANEGSVYGLWFVYKRDA